MCAYHTSRKHIEDVCALTTRLGNLVLLYPERERLRYCITSSLFIPRYVRYIDLYRSCGTEEPSQIVGDHLDYALYVDALDVDKQDMLQTNRRSSSAPLYE